jgi:hypothetical protein
MILNKVDTSFSVEKSEEDGMPDFGYGFTGVSIAKRLLTRMTYSKKAHQTALEYVLPCEVG